MGRARDDLDGSESSGLRGHRTTTDAACILPEASKNVPTVFDCFARWRSLRADRAFVAAYFVIARRRKACRLSHLQHGGARSGARFRPSWDVAGMLRLMVTHQADRIALGIFHKRHPFVRARRSKIVIAMPEDNLRLGDYLHTFGT